MATKNIEVVPIEKILIKVDQKQILETPIDKVDFLVKNRHLLRVHIEEDGFTLYFREAGAEVAYASEWDEATKAAFQVFLNYKKD